MHGRLCFSYSGLLKGILVGGPRPSSRLVSNLLPPPAPAEVPPARDSRGTVGAVHNSGHAGKAAAGLVWHSTCSNLRCADRFYMPYCFVHNKRSEEIVCTLMWSVRFLGTLPSGESTRKIGRMSSGSDRRLSGTLSVVSSCECVCVCARVCE
jgi:hypothetical protein